VAKLLSTEHLLTLAVIALVIASVVAAARLWPGHGLCSPAGLISAAALWSRQPLLVKLTHFWGLAGTANGLITPDISDHFPSFGFM